MIQPARPRSLAISILAYNEENTIQPLIEDCMTVLERNASDYAIYVINDGSRDRTGTLLDEMAHDNPRLHVQHHETNLGFGPTLRQAFQLPTQDAIFLIAGDGQMPPKEVERLLPALEEADLVIGWRKDRQDSLLRKILSEAYNFFISLLLKRRVRDVDSSVLVKRSIVERISFTSHSAFLHAELVLQAQRLGFRWIEIPVGHRRRLSGSSAAFRLHVIIPALWDLLIWALGLR